MLVMVMMVNIWYQVVYRDEEDGQQYLLYLVASSSGDRQAWVNAIATGIATVLIDVIYLVVVLLLGIYI